MSLRFSYTLLAPFYDLLIRPAFDAVRKSRLTPFPTGGRVLLDGIGTGLDLAHLPAGNSYVGLDITAAMLRKSKQRCGAHEIDLVQGDAMCLPFADASFDHALLHLILAVVPQPAKCLAEAARVLKPGGSVWVLDKFLRPGEFAPLRRVLNIFASRVATRTDVVFEEALAQVPTLKLLSDEPLAAGGWFRGIKLVKVA